MSFRLANHWFVIAFTLLYITPALWRALSGGKMEFVLYVAVMLILFIPVLIIHRRVRLHPLALWGLSLWGLAHMCGGLVEVPASMPTAGESPVLYNWWIIPERLKFDQVVHAFGFGLTTWICWQGLKWAFADHGSFIQPTPGLLTLCAAGGMGFGAMNEVVEFVATLTLPETNVGGYVNTGWDLVANLIGTLIAVTLIAFLDKRPNAADQN